MSSTISNSINAINTNSATPLSSSSGGTGNTGTSSSGSASSSANTAAATIAGTPTTGTLSSIGIGSGINANALISSLMAASQGPITAINTDISNYQAKLTGFDQLTAAVYAFQTALGGLTSASSFQATAATPSDPTSLSAATTAAAVPGNYSIAVGTLAQPESLVATGQASATATVGSGASTTVDIQFGTISGGSLDASTGTYSGASFSPSTAAAGGVVTINSSNNSLQGIAAAINAANLGVTASIVNDGSAVAADGSSGPYRLELTSTATGANTAMKVSVTGDATLASLLGQDPAGTQNLQQTEAAQNASVTVNGLAITSTSNTVSNAITGTTLTLLSPNSSTNLSIAQNTSAIVSNVQAFVTAYNTLDSSINSLTADGVGGAAGGALQGQFNVQQMQTQLRESLAQTMVDATGKQATLASIGVTFDAKNNNGQLLLDNSKLNQVMATNPAEVGSLFAQNGTTSDGLVNFVSANADAAPGTYKVDVGTLPTQGTLVGSAAAGTTITSGVNDALTAVVDGTSVNVTLPAGSYTADSLAAAVQSAINGASAMSKAGKSVSVSQTGGVLTLTSASWGKASVVSLGGDAAAGLVGDAPVNTIGVDISGTIDGLPALGSGQTLTGLAGSAVDGVTLNVVGGSTGARGTVSVSQGFANILNNLATQFTSPKGLITSATNALNSDISNDNSQITRLQTQLALLQQQYTAEFTHLDTVVAGLNNTQSYLSSQLASLANTTAYIYGSSYASTNG